MISLRNLNLSIHRLPILKDVGFDIAQGQIFGLVGESGSGKSMTALALMQLLPQGFSASGQVMVDGTDVLALSEAEMCALRGNEIGMIFQEPMTALNPVQTIGDQVAETLLIHGKANKTEAAKIARHMLNRVGLPEDKFPASRYPHELSGGQRQRVCIAMAIALRPKLLIADEPTTALDVTTQAQILELLQELVAEEDMSLLLITHDLAVVAGMADYVAVMRKGEIVEQGETEHLFKTMSHPYTRQLFEASSHQPDHGAVTQETPILEVINATREYAAPRSKLFHRPPPFRAVDNVSFTLKRGESLGLVGESGCGKSTLTRAILGLDPLQGGEIRLSGEPVLAGQHMPTHLRQKVQVVFQDPYGSFNPRHKVLRLVMEPFHLTTPPDNAREHVAEALETVGMPADAMDRYIHEFSGGQRQRIAIARALVLHPDLIVLDEAVSALDVSIRAQILDLLADLQKRLGLSYLFISHDLTVVQAITDRVLVMQRGKIVETGPTEQVFMSPAHPYTKQLLNAAPQIPADWQAR
ncbi:ABC transporter ATP-binding protein [Profundibacter sp.]|uniref:ABC transporter ATP-binding protein n=1 Tax=Profundibacter sp. TaxID=3101071 RepID=UPI003D0C7822